MKAKHLMWAALCLAAVTFTSCENQDNPVVPTPDPKPEYDLRVLTFEDEDYKGGDNMVGKKDWSSLIDNEQYDGDLLYNNPNDEYYWSDENNTFLAFTSLYYPYWSGGQAISNYTDPVITNGSFMTQLQIPLSGGHNGSKNFCVHFGYSGYTGPTGLPAIYFMDGVERVIDHMYVTNTSHALNSMLGGDAFAEGLGSDGWFKIIATGLDANGDETGTAEFFLAKDGKPVEGWQKFDLTSLGKVLMVRFDVDGTDKGTYGLNTPGYFAYDDVAVRFPNK